MSREIKFRAWREDVVVTEPYGRNSFEQKFMENDIDDMKTREFASFEEKGCVKAHRVDIMQYIGVKDKNGKEIYEGDIVRTNNGRLCKVVWFSSPQYQGWDLEAIETKNPPPDKNRLWEDLEVVGNVYENANLLKEAGNE